MMSVLVMTKKIIIETACSLIILGLFVYLGIHIVAAVFHTIMHLITTSM